MAKPKKARKTKMISEPASEMRKEHAMMRKMKGKKAC